MRIASVIVGLSLISATPPTAWAAEKPIAKPAASTSKTLPIPRARDGHPEFDDTLWSMPYQALVEAVPGMADLVVSEERAKAMYKGFVAVALTNENLRIDGEAAAAFTDSLGFPLVRGERHTRLLISPADGRLPMRPEARREFGAAGAAVMMKLDNPEDRPAGERCLDQATMPPATFLIGAPRQFVVTPEAVAIHSEYADEIIIAPFAKEHGPWAMHPQYGDSIARWEGDTLVIETVNFPAWNKMRVTGNLVISPEAKVTERYTRVSANEIVYQFTVDDPKIYTAAWTGEYSFYPVPGGTYASSCHEGNYSLPNILGAAREAERQAAAKKP
ncbi:MAG: hypothetical protein JWO33_1833 [Caulobacteraceae bacterium]|nr:hypothetical protein [Caulobacteraceae bacterium]